MDKIFDTIKSYLDEAGIKYRSNKKKRTFKTKFGEVIQIHRKPSPHFIITVPFAGILPSEDPDMLSKAIDRCNSEQTFSRCEPDAKKAELLCISTFYVDPPEMILGPRKSTDKTTK